MDLRDQIWLGLYACRRQRLSTPPLWAVSVTWPSMTRMKSAGSSTGSYVRWVGVPANAHGTPAAIVAVADTAVRTASTFLVIRSSLR